MTQIVVHELAPILLTSKPAGVDGIAKVETDKVQAGQALLVDRANTYTTSSLATMLDIYEDQVTPSNRLSGSSSGNRDEADFPLGLQVGPNKRLVAVWTGCSTGAICTLRLQVRRAYGEGMEF